MRKIKIAQIGLNTYSHSTEIFESLKKQQDLFEIVGYVLPENEQERLPEKAKALEGYRELTLEEVLNDPEIEAVAIETDEIYLTKYALLCAKASKHIHMEKPGGQNLADFEELISAMKKTCKVFHTGYMYRYNPEVVRLMERVKGGQLGQIVSVEAQMNSNHGDQQRSFLSNFNGGIMFFLGCHLVDLILQIQGIPKNVIAFNKCTKKSEIDVTDYSMAVFEYDNGISFAKTCSVEKGGFARRQLVVTGTKGTVELKPFEMHSGGTKQYTGVTEFLIENPEWIYMGENRRSDFYDRYDHMMSSFAAMVRGEKQNPYTLDYELDLYKLLLECCGVK
jgi:predicted dehydrogenase